MNQMSEPSDLSNCYRCSIHPDWDETFTEEQLLAIDAIEASYTSPFTSSSSSPVSSYAVKPERKEASPGYDQEYRNPKIRRQLPRSIFSPTQSKRYAPYRCRANLRRYPTMRFGGKIIYSRTSSDVDKAAMQLLKILETKRGETGEAVLGVDIEWKPSFRKGVMPGKAAVVQICVDSSFCHVMQIIHSGIPQSLQYLLEESKLLKVGVGIGGDSVKLFQDYGVSIKNVEDLSDLANGKLSGGLKKWGLASLTETLLCKELLKPQRIRLGNWEARILSKEQLQYAATDAFASWHLYQVLKDLPDVVHDAPEEKSDELRGLST